MKRRPASGEGRRLSVHSWMAPAWIAPSWWLAIVLLAITAPGCCPHPPGFIPRINPECSRWDWTTSRNEIRGLASDLADQLPDWESTGDPSVTIDYKGLKAAAIKMTRAPECVRRAIIESYCRAHCKTNHPDFSKASGMFLLMRVLFVVPSRHPASDARKHHSWTHPSFLRPPGSAVETEYDLAWPVHADPGGRVLEIDRCLGSSSHGSGIGYDALHEYIYFEERFPRRTPADIDALEIRARP